MTFDVLWTLESIITIVLKMVAIYLLIVWTAVIKEN
mgnify:CR=1 FL=1